MPVGHNFAKTICKAIATALILLSLEGCKVGPNFVRPGAQIKPQWSLAENPRMQGEPANAAQWWAHFEDPVLDELIQRSLAENLTLREAGHRVLESRARRAVAVGNLLPQSQTVDGAFTHSRLSSVTANFFAIPGIFEPNIYPDNWNNVFSANWELDFWGRYRRAIESADASLNASIANYDDAVVILLAEVAQTYIEMRTLESRLILARRNLQIQNRTLTIAKQKKEAGLASAIDVAQAETNYGQTEAIVPNLEIQRRQASHRLCVLLGRNPEDLASELGFTGQIPRPPHNIAFGVPADLIRRRPDIQRAESELAVQSARIGIAQAEFYPHISLNGSIGFSAEEFGQMFQSRSHVGVISPQFRWNLLNYARIRNNVEAEKALFQQRCDAYYSQVLNALAEAEDAQVAFVYNFDRAESLSKAVSGATTAVEKAELSYQVGTIDFGRVYVLQAEMLRQQDQLAATEGQIATSLVGIFKSLGGGWEIGRTAVPYPQCVTRDRSMELLQSTGLVASPNTPIPYPTAITAGRPEALGF